MIESVQVHQPASSRAAFEQTGDGIRIALPPVGFLRVLDQGMVHLLWLIIWGYILFYFIVLNVPFWQVFAGIGPLLGLGWLGRLTKLARRKVTITVLEDQLIINDAGIFRTEQLSWLRTQIHAIQTSCGLRVIGNRWERCFFSERDDHELRWVAFTIRQALAVPEERPPGSDEIKVIFTIDDRFDQVDGLMRASRGNLMVWNSRAKFPRFQFCHATSRSLLTTRLQSWFLGIEVSIPISPDEVTCRIDEDGKACLKIALWGGKYVTKIWNPNKDELQVMLARFWGATE